VATEPAQQALRLGPAPRIGGGTPRLFGRATALRAPGELLDALQHA